MKALQTDSNSFEFFLNDKVMFKLTVTLLIIYFSYLVLGFLGIFFIFFYLSLQRLFYRIKKYILVFDLYIRILLWASKITSIHNFTFNKLLELIDKAYVQNFFMLLFIIPLFGHFNPQSQASSYPSDNFLRYMYISLLAFIGSTFMLILYTKLILQRYNLYLDSTQINQQKKSTRSPRLIHQKMFLIFSGSILTSIYIVLFYSFGTFYLMLSIIIGFSVHILQLVYTNKIRVKKFLNVRLNRYSDESFIQSINTELSESTSYLKSVNELSFASILLEVNKVLLISYFFLQNLRE